MPVNWMEVLLGATDIGKSLQSIRAFNELRRQRDIEGTQPIEEWIKKYGWTPELGKLGPEFDRYLKSRGISLPRTTPLGASGETQAPYDVPQEPLLTAESQAPDTSLLGRMIGAQKSGGRGYISLPEPTHEQIIEREKLTLMKEPGRAREQAEIAHGLKRTKIAQESFDVEKGRARISAINALANNTDADLKDVQEYTDAILEGKVPTKDLPAKATEAKQYQKVMELQKNYIYLDGKNRNKTPLTDDESIALAILGKFGGAQVAEDGTIQIIPVKEPKITVERDLPPDPTRGETLPSEQYSYTNVYKNGKLISRLPSKRVSEPAGPSKPEAWQGKSLERVAMSVLRPEMYEAWKQTVPEKQRSMVDFLAALKGGFAENEPSYSLGMSYLSPERQKEQTSIMERAAALMRSEKLDEFAAYNKATFEAERKKKQAKPSPQETKPKSDIEIPPEKEAAVRRRITVLKGQGKTPQQIHEIISTEIHEGKL